MFHSLQNAALLHRQGHIDEAARLYQQVLRAEPRSFEALYSFGLLKLQQGDCESAQDLIGRALAIRPDFVEGLLPRGIALLRLGRPEAALACFDRAIAFKPGFVEAHATRATVLLEMQRYNEALAGFDAALALDPRHAISWNNRGNTLVAMRRFEEAVASYDRALEIAADLPQARDNRMNALFELGRATRCPPGFMRTLFDDFAPHYDQTMLDKLGYRAHLHLKTLADRILPPRKTPWRILDLGSGTGLVGDTFRSLAEGGRLDGIDLSPRMIEMARARGIYDDLILGDLETVLAAPGPRYDLVLAADTMIYLGDLRPAFAGAANRLEPGGFYIFAVESLSGEAWEQTSTNRFRHSETYLRGEAKRAGLDFAAIMECTLRHESGAPVPGYTAALHKAG